TLPIGKCYIAPPDWLESGMAHVIVTRVRPSGNLVMASFLVDTFCLGVKDAGVHENITPCDFEEYLDNYKNGIGLEEISYNEAHNIIYGAMAFAEEGGITPPKEFDPAGYILEEDTDDIPLIEYDFGKNGKHFLVVNPDRKEMSYFHTLKKKLGDDFEYVMPYGEEYEEEDYDEYSPLSKIDCETIKKAFEGMSKWEEESDRHPDEKYTYQYPDYPQTLSVKNQFIADELLSPDNYSCLPREVIDRILALPKDEAAQDISDVILYSIGKTYKGINDDTIEGWHNSAIMHSLILLAQLQSDKGLDAVLEIMRQTGEFADYHLGDLTPELLHPALYACGKDNIPAIESYLNQPGLDSYLRSQAPDALAMIIFNQPERRGEIIEMFRRLLNNMISNLPIQKACDGTFAGFVMSNLMDIDASELIPEIKDTFATNCVNKTIAGDCKTVIKDIELGRGAIRNEKYQIPDIYEQYDSLKKFITKPE
ncbi:MAG: DUF1186 family protein, partial [Paramuribaculum sp.]|nr:DUF1186 family protein [Paramuribaculum sp.]